MILGFAGYFYMQSMQVCRRFAVWGLFSASPDALLYARHATIFRVWNPEI